MRNKLIRHAPLLIVIVLGIIILIFTADASGHYAPYDETATTPSPYYTPPDDATTSSPDPDTAGKSSAATPRTPSLHIVDTADEAPATVQAADLMFGQQVYLNDGALYYESADQLGSGRHNTAGNRYTEVLRISGFAKVDLTTGHPIYTEVYTRDDIPIGQKAPDFVRECTPDELWIGLSTDGFETGDVGWSSIYEIRWQDGSIDITPETEDHLSTAENLASYPCNHYLNLCYILDEAYAVDHDKVEQFYMNYNYYERLVWARGSTLILSGERTYYPQRQCNPYPDDHVVGHINTWIQDQEEKWLNRNDDDRYIWAKSYSSYTSELHSETLSRPFHGQHDVLIIVTDTHARNYANLQPCDAFEQVIVIDVSPAYEIDPDFAAQITAAYGPISEITADDAYNYSLQECLDAFS